MKKVYVVCRRMQTTVDGLRRKVAEFARKQRFMQIKKGRQIGPDSICDANSMFDESCMRVWNELSLRENSKKSPDEE